jgi:mRNA degradation ribonuclease J1/J2
LSQIYVDGTETGDTESDVIKDRQIMSSEGVITVTLLIGEGMLLREPDIVSNGVFGETNKHLVKIIQKDIEKKTAKLLQKRLSAKEIETNIKASFKNHVYKLTKRNPIITIQVIDI